MYQNTFKSAIQQAWQAIQSAPIQPKTYRLSIKKKYDGLPLIQVYAQCFPHVDISYWEDKITNGNLLLNGKPTHTQVIVKAGYVTTHTVMPQPEPEVNPEIALIHADINFWVVNKPSPLPVHAGGRYLNHTLTPRLKEAFPEQNIHLINRLDANTTGIVLVALNKQTAFQLGKQFELRGVTKNYLALVEGTPSEDNFTSTASISKEKTSAGGRKIDEGTAASTRFETMQKWDDKSLIKVIPRSGRTNQIRLHLAHLNLPIVGDLGYKDPTYFKNNPLTYPTDTLFLHAWKLSFNHPDTDERITFEAPTNKKWQTFI